MSSPAFDALIEQVLLAFVTLITPVFASTEQPVEPVELKLTTPVPVPPVVVAVPVLPNVMLVGTVSASAA